MKRILLIMLFILFFVSCKTTEKINVQHTEDVDSTEIVNLKRQLYSSKKELATIFTQLSEKERENKQLKRKIRTVVEKFDTNKPDNPVKERITYSLDEENIKKSEKEVLENEQLEKENNHLSIEIADLQKKNKLLKLQLEKIKSEGKVGLNKFERFSIWGFWVIVIGFLGYVLIRIKI